MKKCNYRKTALALTIHASLALPVFPVMAAVQSGQTVDGIPLQLNTGDSYETSNAPGVLVINGGAVTGSGFNVITQGQYSDGLHTIGRGSSATISNINIDSSGDGSRGIEASSLSQINVNGGTITTSGNRVGTTGSAGLVANSGSTIDLTNTAVSTSGITADGIVSETSGGTDTGGASVTMTGGSILTTGDSSKGAVAYGGNNSLTLDGVFVTTQGALSKGMVAADVLNGSASNINLNNSTINTRGDTSIGLSAQTGATVSGSNNTILTQGINSSAVNITSGGSITLTDSTLTTAGQNSAGIHIIDATNAVNNVMLVNSTVSVASSASIASESGSATINLNNVAMTQNNGVLLDNAATSLTDLKVTNASELSGNVMNTQGGTANLMLDNSSWSGMSQNASQITLQNNANWQLTGDSSVKTLNNSGNIIIGQSSTVDTTLQVEGDYIGNGGHLSFNTQLADDSSPTDKLVVGGNTSGSTSVSVNNLGGSGAQTLNGIELITVQGASNGEFIQDGRIVAGAYDYTLGRGVSSGTSGNWYLTSSANTQVPLTPIVPGSPVVPVEPMAPGAPVTSPSDPVVYRPEAGSYTANLAAANTMFITTLHDRLGETQYTDALTGEKKVTSLWLRQVGTHNNFRDNSGQLKTQSNQYTVQLGGDLAQWSQDGLDRGHLGMMAGYGNNHSNTQSSVSGYHSNGDVDGYSVGVYGTWFANDTNKTGLYVDSWAQYGWFNNSVKGEGLSEENYKSNGLTASLESGYTWEMGEFSGSKGTSNSWYLQPQAQAIWMGVQQDDHTESNGTKVKGNGDNNLQTRLGLRAYIKGHSALDDGSAREFEPFVEMNWLHNTDEFGNVMDGVQVTQAGTRNIGEIKTGVEGKLSDRLTLWGNVAQQIGDKSYSNTQAMLGVKYGF